MRLRALIGIGILDILWILNMYTFVYLYEQCQSWCSGTKCDCKRDWLSVRSPLQKVKYLFIFIFLFLRSGDEAKARRWVLALITQCLQISAESGEWSGLTLSSLCLLCWVRDTAWSWFFFILLCTYIIHLFTKYYR